MSYRPPLSLYVHIPWCVQKCPYCDFNSHTLKAPIPEENYIHHLLNDLEQDFPLISDREIHTIFIGGGTPSLLSAQALETLLIGIRARTSLSPTAEITLEANPGTIEAARFQEYHRAGINRISIGIQSFQDKKLINLGRIHDSKEAKTAAKLALGLNLRSVNLDLMHGLPDQSLEEALSDLREAVALNPTHLSWYQLTLEPGTLFGSKPPILPDEDVLWEIFTQGHQLLTSSGYQQYEISAYSKPGYQCEHNLNYWRFGDYLGIGCGAHGKLTQPDGQILRTIKTKHPRGYMTGQYLSKKYPVLDKDKPFEYFMNRLRLLEPIPREEFQKLTHLSEQIIRESLNKCIKNNYILETEKNWQVTQKGKLFFNNMLEMFI